MDKKKIILYVVFAVLLGVSIYFNFSNHFDLSAKDEQINSLKNYRDSTLNSELQKSIDNELKSKTTADSAIAKANEYQTTIKSLNKRDSINRFYFEIQKKQIPYLTAVGRNRMLDSILLAAHIR